MTVDPKAQQDIVRRCEAVRARVSLSTLVGKDVALRRRGREWVGLCPFHADSKVGSFSVNDDKELAWCFSCGGGGDHFKYLQLRLGVTFMQALRMLEADAGIDFRAARADPEWEHKRQKRLAAAANDSERRRRNAEGLWLHGATLRGTPAQRYLEGRGIDFAKLGRMPGSIRFRHDCSHPGRAQPLAAMLTKMSFLDKRHAATHRTFLEFAAGTPAQTGGWGKARVERAKMILGDFAGAHIPISKGDLPGVALADVPEGTAVAISEGIEDGLSVALADPQLYVVAAGALGNIGGLALPPQVGDVILICQNDAAGSAADAALERAIARHQEAGR